MESASESESELVSPLVNLLIKLRNKARENKNWQEADLIRDQLEEIGIEVIDSPHGTEWEINKVEEK